MKELINDENNIVPDKKILYYYDDRQNGESGSHNINDLIETLTGNVKRDWFMEHYYYCLPLTIANQYGFVVKAYTDLEIYYAGEEAPAALKVGDSMELANKFRPQRYYTNFQNGVISIENNFQLRTPPNVNLMVIQPPNYFIEGIHCVSGVVEADNLSRTFTFNLKVTQPGKKIKIKKGQWLAAFIPVPRFYVDSFSLEPAENYISNGAIINAQHSSKQLTYQREHHVEEGGDLGKKNNCGRKYFNGLDFDDTPFINEHQKRVVNND